ncbi:hypothetical protein A3Q56_02712 [Intoshia linei]|uniref:Protein ABHD13 n=1 Tax=Intoshia linei TaxID=1819745 RepID=A0A177B5G5_9BILA|nr:hypothetical protein A3Q56_02712 [Intoshia linei]
MLAMKYLVFVIFMVALKLLKVKNRYLLALICSLLTTDGIINFQKSIFKPHIGNYSLPVPSYLKLESFYIKTADNENLHTFFIPSDVSRSEKENNSPTLVYLSGNAGSIRSNIWTTEILYKLKIFNIFMIDYRGFGLSTGEPSEKGKINNYKFYNKASQINIINNVTFFNNYKGNGMIEDLKAALLYLQKYDILKNKKVVIMAHSLGGAVLISALNSNLKCCDKNIVLITIINTFSSLRNIAIRIYGDFLRLINYLPNVMLLNKVSKTNYKQNKLIKFKPSI